MIRVPSSDSIITMAYDTITKDIKFDILKEVKVLMFFVLAYVH